MYVDAGADDTEDEEIKVVTTGLDLVDTSVAKTYTITYTAIEQDVNETVATRTVKVIELVVMDKIPPVITSNSQFGKF
jgi:hypothetical protein